MPNKGRDLTKRPLTPKQLATLEGEASKQGPKSDHFRLFMAIRYAGMHPRVIFPYDYSDDTKVKEYNLHETTDQRGKVVFDWDRPKKRGAKAHTTIPKHPAITFSIDEFINDIRGRKSKYKRSTLYASRLLHEIGEDAGVPGFSALSLRHSLAVELLKGGMEQKDVCDTLNIAPSTLRTYGRYIPEDRHSAYDRAMGVSE